MTRQAPAGLLATLGVADWAAGPFPGSRHSPIPAGRADGTSRPAQVVAPTLAYRNSPTSGTPSRLTETEPAPRLRAPSSRAPLGALAVLARAPATGRKLMFLGESHGEAGVQIGLGSGRE